MTSQEAYWYSRESDKPVVCVAAWCLNEAKYCLYGEVVCHKHYLEAKS